MGGLKHAVNPSHNTKKATMKKVYLQKNKFAKAKKYGAHVPSSVVPQKIKKYSKLLLPLPQKKIYSKMKIALKKNLRKKYVTKMKKRISHTQSTTNYCLISSTFQKSFKKNLPL